MSVTGTVKNGVVVLPSGVNIPEGSKVTVETTPNGDDAFVSALEKLAKPRPHLPKDYALNHGHYVRGEPKK